MWRSKKFLVIASLVAVVLAGSIGGVALAQTGDEEDSPPAGRLEAMLERVCEIYNENPDRPGDIDCDILKDAAAQYRDELKAEAEQKMAQTREQFRQKLIDEGKVTQEQLDQWDEWLDSKPDIQIPFGPEDRGGIKPFGGLRGFGGGFHRWGGPPCAPETLPEE